MDGANHEDKPMALFQLILAAAMYAVGGLFMKLSDGVSRPGPTAVFIVLFVLAATVQAMGMRRADMGPSYIFVLGAETLASALLSVLYLHEQWSPLRISAVFLVVLGIALLRPS
jgi:small multidrug resistance pump/quaternary ammonium compound-resistance protein SugE